MHAQKLPAFLFVLVLTAAGCQKGNHPKEPTGDPIDPCTQNDCCEAVFEFRDGILDFYLKPCALEQHAPTCSNLNDPNANDDCGTESSFFMDYIVDNGLFICNAATCPCGSGIISLGQSCYFLIKHFPPEENSVPCQGASGICLKNHYYQEDILQKQKQRAEKLRERGAMPDCRDPRQKESPICNPMVSTLRNIPLCVGNHCQCGHKESLDGKCSETGYPFCGTQAILADVPMNPSYLDFGPENIEDYLCELVDGNKYTHVRRRQETTIDYKAATKSLPGGGHAHGVRVKVHHKGELLSTPFQPESVWTCQKALCACGNTQIKQRESCLSVRTDVYGECPDGAIPDRIDGQCIIDFHIDRYPGCGNNISTFDTSDYVCKNGEWVCSSDSCACGSQNVIEDETCSCRYANFRTQQCLSTDKDPPYSPVCSKDAVCKGSAYASYELCQYSDETYTQIFRDLIKNPKEYKEIDGQKVCQNKTCSCGNLTLSKGQTCAYIGYTGQYIDYTHECDTPRACLVDHTHHQNPYAPPSNLKKSDYFLDSTGLIDIIYCDEDNVRLYSGSFEQNNTTIDIEDFISAPHTSSYKTPYRDMRAIYETAPVWRCDKERGCSCGSQKCKSYGICTKKGCVYDTGKESDYTEMDSYAETICGFKMYHDGIDMDIPWNRTNTLMRIEKSGLCTCGVSTMMPVLFSDGEGDSDDDPTSSSVDFQRIFSCRTTAADELIQSLEAYVEDPDEDDKQALVTSKLLDKLKDCLEKEDLNATLGVSVYQCDDLEVDGKTECVCGKTTCQEDEYCITASAYTKSPKCISPNDFYLQYLQKTFDHYCK